MACLLRAEVSGETAAGRLEELQGRLVAARKGAQWTASRDAAYSLYELLNQGPSVSVELARADLHVGRNAEAFRLVREFVRMGQYSDKVAGSVEFAGVWKQTGGPALRRRMEGNKTPIETAGSEQVAISERDMLPEDVDWDEQRQRFLLTSVRESKIVSMDERGKLTEFARSPDGWPMLAIKVDARRGVAWATEVALQGYTWSSKEDWGRSALLRFDLRDGRLLGRMEGPKGSALGDFALTDAGDVIASDGDGGGLYLASGDSGMKRLDDGEFISPQTPAMDPDGRHVFVPDYARGIGVYDLKTRAVRWLAARGRFALDGIDGLYFAGNKLMAVQNGVSPERVVVFSLNAAHTEIVNERVLERSTATLHDPTHGVVRGSAFYYIADSGWDVIDSAGRPLDPQKHATPHIVRAGI